MALDRVLPDLQNYQRTLLRTSLSTQQEQVLRQALAQHLVQAA